MKKREAGILLPIFSLPGKYGIGCFSEQAFRFADFLKRSGQSCWQILPVGPTGYGDSPYQSFSTFAGNPYFISLEELIRQGLLLREECDEADFGNDESHVDYGKLYEFRRPLLKKAFSRSRHQETEEYREFSEKNDYWLEDYSLFMAIKDAHHGAALETWEADIRQHDASACKRWAEQLGEEVSFYRYLQFEFDRQWKKLRQYVNDLGIRIIGDIPIYVSADSSDFWAHPDLFMLDERGRIRMIAGAIRCTTGYAIKKPALPGGKSGSGNVFRCMIPSGSIISEALTSFLPCLRTRTLPSTVTGRRGREWICSTH